MTAWKRRRAAVAVDEQLINKNIAEKRHMREALNMYRRIGVKRPSYEMAQKEGCAGGGSRRHLKGLLSRSQWHIAADAALKHLDIYGRTSRIISLNWRKRRR